MKLTQPIRWLIQGLADQTKAEKRWIAETPLERPTDDSAIRIAIDVLRNFDEMAVGDHIVKIDGLASMVEPTPQDVGLQKS